MVADSELIERLREFLRNSDLNTTTTAIVRRKLEDDFGVDLSDKKAFIREQVDLFLQSEFEKAEQEQEPEEENEAGGDDLTEEIDCFYLKEEEDQEENDGDDVDEYGEEAEVVEKRNLKGKRSEINYIHLPKKEYYFHIYIYILIYVHPFIEIAIDLWVAPRLHFYYSYILLLPHVCSQGNVKFVYACLIVQSPSRM